MVSVGDRAPDFELPGTDPDGDEAVREYRLSEVLDGGPVVVNFYLFDFHPTCTENLCDLHDLSWFEFDEDTTVFGVSADGVYSHGAFADAESIGVPLLSDSDGRVAESYGVLYEELAGHYRIANRSVFVLAPDRTVRYAWVADDPGEHPDWTTVKEAVDELGRAEPGT